MRRSFTIGFLFVIYFILISNRVQAGIRVVGDLTRERMAVIGERYTGKIIVENDGHASEEVKIYQTDYSFSFDGTSQYGEPQQMPRSNAGWIDFGPKRVIIPPGQQASILFSVKVPLVETLSGTYWSMLMVEAIPETSPESIRSRGGVGINTILRYGIQMVTHIGNSGVRRIKFLGASLFKESGQRTLQIDIENVGERFLRPRIWVDVYDVNGKHMGMFEGSQLRTYPGTSVRHRIDLSRIPRGVYKTLVVADCGGDDLFGIQYKMYID